MQLPEKIVCNSTLWAACIGGAAQRDAYSDQIEAAGLMLVSIEDNQSYRFISDSAQGVSTKYGVKGVSLLATKPARGLPKGHPRGDKDARRQGQTCHHPHGIGEA